MASIFKRGKRRNEPYLIQYVDHLGKRRTVKGFTDKGLTEQLAAKLESEARLRQTGMIDPEQERLAEQMRSAIETHLAAFQASLADNTPKHVKLTMTRVRRIAVGCDFLKLADITAETVHGYLRELRAEDGIGNRTNNHYIQAFDSFCKWCVSTKRLVSNLIEGIELLNTAVDVRRKRRALTVDEVARMVASARESGVSIQRFDGEQRARIYILSYMTGLRKNELASLTPRSFDLDGSPPTLTVEAAFSKHRRTDVLPLHPELVILLRGWLQGLKAGDRLFPKLDRRKTWLMVQKDLERAGIPYETPEGIADFHAAGRHTHITELLRNGATLPEAMRLARHADIHTTMRYTHIGIEDQARAIANLPALQMRCISDGAEGQSLSPDGPDEGKEKSPTPCQHRGLGVESHPLTTDGIMEAAGIAPASREASVMASTCVADLFVVGLGTPVGRVSFGLASYGFSPCRNRRLDTGDPELASPAEPLGRRFGARP